MKIRTKISLWITSAGIIVSLLFSLIVFLEMIEQNYNQLDDGLKATVRTVLKIVKQDKERGIHAHLISEIFLDSRHYWIRAWRADTLIYSSKLAQIIDLPVKPNKKKDTISITLPRKKIHLDQDKNNEVTFRIRSETISPDYLIQVALPMEELEEEINEVILIIIGGLSFSTLLLIFISYFLAGRIIQPVRKITKLARDIDENDLNLRIPLNPNHDELYDLSLALNQMLDRLQYSFTRQKQFLADAAHEINTPMTSIHIFMEQNLCNRELPAPFQRQLLQQQQVMQRIKRLLQDLMTLSRLEISRKFTPEKCNLVTITEAVIEDFRPLLEEKNITLSRLMPAVLNYFGDPALLRRTVINVISNSVKYNQQDGELIVTLKQSKKDIQLTVTNTGVQIAETDLEQIFEQFYRVEKSRSQELGGCGLGLTIVREIVKLHGGRVSLKNVPPDKICLTIILPFSLKKPA
ncbi:MAG: HAMP domain-containing histidine kinase [Deltaproteobacteria bacterium]|nr:HAMP domain-containing histidine kinase [Candidatus Tharpella sp.]